MRRNIHYQGGFLNEQFFIKNKFVGETSGN